MVNEVHSFLRPLGMSERFYWIFDSLACTNFAVIAEVVGDLSGESVKNAFSRGVARHPAYRLRVVAGPGHRLDYFVASVQEALDGLDIKVVENRSIHDVVVDEIDTSFAPGSCPMVRCRILADVPVGRTSIVFTFHHCMTDALGAMALIQDLLADGLFPESEGGTTRLNPSTAETYTAGQETLYPGRYRGCR